MEGLLQPRYPTQQDTRAIAVHQQIYNDCHARPQTNHAWRDCKDTTTGRSTWSTGTCNEVIQLRSYEVHVGARQYRYNQRQLLKTKKPSPSSDQKLPVSPGPDKHTQEPPEESTITDNHLMRGDYQEEPVGETRPPIYHDDCQKRFTNSLPRCLTMFTHDLVHNRNNFCCCCSVLCVCFFLFLPFSLSVLSV